MKKILCLLLTSIMLFCMFPRSIMAEEKIDYFKNTPLMRYGILATYYYEDRTFLVWHSLTGKRLADVMVLYFYDDRTEDIYEVKRLWLTKKPEGF